MKKPMRFFIPAIAILLVLAALILSLRVYDSGLNGKKKEAVDHYFVVRSLNLENTIVGINEIMEAHQSALGDVDEEPEVIIRRMLRPYKLQGSTVWAYDLNAGKRVFSSKYEGQFLFESSDDDFRGYELELVQDIKKQNSGHQRYISDDGQTRLIVWNSIRFQNLHWIIGTSMPEDIYLQEIHFDETDTELKQRSMLFAMFMASLTIIGYLLLLLQSRIINKYEKEDFLTKEKLRTISENKRIAEKQAKEQSYKWLQTVANLHEPIVYFDVNLSITFINNSALIVLFDSTEKTSDLNIDDAFPGEQIEIIQDYIRRKSTFPNHDPLKVRLDYGNRRVFDWYLTPIFDNNKKLIEIQAIGKDRSVNQRLDQIIADNTLAFIDMLTEFRQGMLLIENSPQRIVYMNSVASSILGREFNQTQGLEEFISSLSPINIDKHEIIEYTMQNPKFGTLNLVIPIRGSSLLKTIKFEYRILHNTPVFISPMAGKFYYLMLVTDITSDQNHESEMERLKASVSSNYKFATVGKFSEGVANEVLSFINEVTGRFELLELDATRAGNLVPLPSIQDQVKTLTDDAYNMASIVRTFLDYTRTDDACKSPQDLTQILRDVNTVMDRHLTNQGIDFDLKINNEIPWFLLNRSSIEQSFIGMIQNSIDAFNEVLDDRKKEIQISVFATGGNVIVEFKDNGIGMTEFETRNIFQPFSSPKKKKHGTGLGLWLAKLCFVDEHHGEFNVESKKNMYTRFSIVIPILNTDVQQEEVK